MGTVTYDCELKVRVTKRQRRQLEILARKLGLKMAVLMRAALEEHMVRHSRPQPS
jgi:hypothetical protein